VLACRNVFGDGRFGSDDGAGTEPHVTDGPRLPRHHHAVLQGGAAGNADLGGEQRIATDLHAVRHHHQVVDLGAGADPRPPPPQADRPSNWRPISTSSSMTTRATCGIFSCPPSAAARNRNHRSR
jgi:hypothetical protein